MKAEVLTNMFTLVVDFVGVTFCWHLGLAVFLILKKSGSKGIYNIIIEAVKADVFTRKVRDS